MSFSAFDCCILWHKKLFFPNLLKLFLPNYSELHETVTKRWYYTDMSENPYESRYERGQESSIGFGRFWDWTKNTAASGAQLVGEAWNGASQATGETAEKFEKWRYNNLGTEGFGGAANKVIDFVQMVGERLFGAAELGAKGVAGFIHNMTNRTETSVENYQAEQEENRVASAPQTSAYGDIPPPTATPDVRTESPEIQR